MKRSADDLVWAMLFVVMSLLLLANAAGTPNQGPIVIAAGISAIVGLAFAYRFLFARKVRR